MPTGYVKDIANKTGRPVASVEKDWAKAKDVVFRKVGRSPSRSRNWGLVTHIFQRIVGKKATENADPTENEIECWLTEAVVESLYQYAVWQHPVDKTARILHVRHDNGNEGYLYAEGNTVWGFSPDKKSPIRFNNPGHAHPKNPDEHPPFQRAKEAWQAYTKATEGVVSMSRGAYFDGGSTQTLPGESIPNFLWMKLNTSQYQGYPEQDDGHSAVGKPAPGEGAEARAKQADALKKRAADHRKLANKDPGKKWVHLKRATELEGIAANMTRDDAGSRVGESAPAQPQTGVAQTFPAPSSRGTSPRRLELERYLAAHRVYDIVLALEATFASHARRPDIVAGKHQVPEDVSGMFRQALSDLGVGESPVSGAGADTTAARDLAGLGRPLDVLEAVIDHLSRTGGGAAVRFLSQAADALKKLPIGEAEVAEMGRGSSRSSTGSAHIPTTPVTPAQHPAPEKPEKARPSLIIRGKYPRFRSSTAASKVAESAELVERVLRHAEPHLKGGLEQVVRFCFERALAAPVTRLDVKGVDRMGRAATCVVECDARRYPGKAAEQVQAVLQRALRGRYTAQVREQVNGRWEVYVLGNRPQDVIFRA